jgi:hypothetical protein
VTEATDVGTRYLELALRMRRLEPDLVERYTGPAWLAETVASAPPPTATALQEDVVALRGGLHDGDTVGAQCLRPLGIGYDVETAVVYRRAEEMLLPLGANTAMLLDDGHSADDVRSYARRWALHDDEFVDGYVESQLTPRDLNGQP